MYEDKEKLKFHVFTNNQDEYVESKREAMKIYRSWIRDDIKDIRIYTIKFNAKDGIYEDVDCIYTTGEFPI